MKKNIWVLLAIALLLRIIALNQSLWLDEGTTAKVAIYIPFLKIIPSFSTYDFHPPLYYYLIKIWTTIFGYSEVALRLPSVIFSLLIGFCIYKIGRLRRVSSESMWAAAFFLFNPLIVYYSQEARMYMMATLFLTCALYFLIQLSPSSQQHNYSKLFWFTLFIILSFYTFYGTIFLILPYLTYLFYKNKKSFYFAAIFFVLAVLLISPLLYLQWIHAKEALKIVVNWRQVLGGANLKNALLIPLKFTIGRISFNPKIIYYLIAGVWSVFILWFVYQGAKRAKVIGWFIVLSLFLGIFFSFFSPILQYFRFLYLLPLMSLLLAQGAKNDRLRIVILTGFLLFSFIYLLVPSFHREDWRTLSVQLKSKDQIYIVMASADALLYYRPDLKINDLKSLNQYLFAQKELVVIPYTADIYGLNYQAILESNGFYKVKDVSFLGGLKLERWKSFFALKRASGIHRR